jgi:hypothetical protein
MCHLNVKEMRRRERLLASQDAVLDALMRSGAEKEVNRC